MIGLVKDSTTSHARPNKERLFRNETRADVFGLLDVVVCIESLVPAVVPCPHVNHRAISVSMCSIDGQTMVAEWVPVVDLVASWLVFPLHLIRIFSLSHNQTSSSAIFAFLNT